jgi:acyl-CoA reductase-like NAD-dependent aldehyde dehydrogenase
MTDELPIVLLHGSATGSYSWAAVRMGVVQGIDYLERNLRRFMRPARRHIALDMRLGSNRIEYQPLGVVGIISPWNGGSIGIGRGRCCGACTGPASYWWPVSFTPRR